MSLASILDEDRATSGEQALWTAVLSNALFDALYGPGSTKADAKLQIIIQARAYLTRPNKDFDQVCSLAGLDPEAVQERTRRLIAKAPSPEELATNRNTRKPKATRV